MKWISIDEQMPKYREVVVAVNEKGYELPFIGKFITGKGFVELSTQNSYEVTHWAELPPYPVKEK